MEMPGCEPVTRFISLQDVPLPEEENLITWSLPRLYTAMDVHVETRPPGAEVFVDGEPYGERTPCRVERTLVRSDRFAEFPTTTIAAMLDGYRNAEVTVDPHDLPSDGVTTITINLIPQ